MATVANYSRARILFAIIVLMACVLAYAPGLGGPLFFDDLPNLTENTYLEFDGSRFDDWRVAILSNDSGVLHRPVAMLTFAVNRVVSGELSPLALKATNLLLHLLTGALLYQLLSAMLATPALRSVVPAVEQRQLVALFATALWLLLSLIHI